MDRREQRSIAAATKQLRKELKAAQTLQAELNGANYLVEQSLKQTQEDLESARKMHKNELTEVRTTLLRRKDDIAAAARLQQGRAMTTIQHLRGELEAAHTLEAELKVAIVSYSFFCQYVTLITQKSLHITQNAYIVHVIIATVLLYSYCMTLHILHTLVSQSCLCKAT